MNQADVFVSVGGTANDEQEEFVRALEERLRSEGITPHTVGRNTFTADAPLKAVTSLMQTCRGTVVVALERLHFKSGTEKRGGPSEKPLDDVKLPTPWTQIEAAMAYTRGLPLLVLVEEGIRSEGLLEHGYDWYVQRVKPTPAALTTPEFNGVLASWKQKIVSAPPPARVRQRSPAEMTLGEIVSGLKPAQLWSCVVAIATLIAGAFAMGTRI